MAGAGLRPGESRAAGPYLLAFVPALLFAFFLTLAPELPRVVRAAWVPTLGVEFTLYVDGLALQFLLLITGIGTLVFVYGVGYLAGDPRRPRLFVLLLVFMVAMIGCVTADSLLALFVFWELTSLTSFLLVGFDHESAASRRAAQQALMVTSAGGLVLLVGIILLGQIAGTFSIQSLIASAPALLGHDLLPAALACIFIGAFTKSAQLPFHFWLPNAMAAPTPVSAYLHSATMVKLGVYLLARLKPAFGTLLLWETTLVTIGALTAGWTMVLAMRERDLKRILAWSTVSALGTLLVMIGLPGAGAAAATSAFLLAHALYKAPLFFVAGNVDHCTGTRSIDHLAGMARTMPWTAAAALLAALSMAGVPLSFGYFAKDLVAIAKVEGEVFAWAGYTTIVVSAVTVAVAAVAGVRVFWHRGGLPLPGEIHEASRPMIAAPLLIAATGAVLGVRPELVDWMLSPAAAAMLPPAMLETSDPPEPAGKLVSLAVFAAGAVIFARWDQLHRLLERLRWADALGSAAWYDGMLRRLPALAGWMTTRVQSGNLATYLAMSVGFVVIALASASSVAWSASFAWPQWSTPRLSGVVAAAAIVASSVAVCIVRDPFVMLLASGLVGVGSAILFLFLGAPDLALTQFAVEVAFVVVVAAVILRVRRLDLPAVTVERRLPRAMLALAAGGLIGAVLLAAGAGPLDEALPRYYGGQSVPAAHGRNVVNVIIVDFRALDTLGEITVVAVAFMAALPLLRSLRASRRTGGDEG